MTFPSQQEIDIIATQILFDAKQAILSLKAWNNSITDGATKMRLFKELIKSTAAQMNGDIGRATSAVSKFSSAMNVNSAAINHVGKELKSADNGFLKLAGSVNTVRIALGVLVSMLIFNVLQAITTVFTEASKQARQLEDTLYRLGNVERDLSLEGIEISLKGLEDGITRIRKKLPIFSREDIAQLVGTIAISTKQLGLTEQQILDLSQAIAILNIRSEKQEDLSTTAQHVLSSLLTGNARGITSLGIAFTENVMKAKAMELGFLEADDALSTLTENEKGITKLNIVLESTGGELNAVNDYLDTNTAKIQANKAAWQDLLTTFGQFINNIIPNVVPVMEKLQKSFELQGLQKLFRGNAPKIGEGADWMDVSIWFKIATGIKFTEKEYERLQEILSKLSDEEILRIFPDPAAIKDRFTRELVQSVIETKDTITANSPLIGEDEVVDEEAMKALEDIEQKIQEIILDAKQAQEDLDLRLEQKQADLDTEYGRKAKDAARNHAEKLVDIETDTRQKIEDAKAKSREEEKKAEDDLLQKLKELRQRFLLDLEDALHARDARQVLRLIKEYKLDKQNLLDRKKLDDQQRKDKLAEDLRAIEIERQRRVEAENIDYKRRLADLALNKAREQAELQLWYKREQEDIQRNIQQKLEKLLAGYITEGKIHETEQAKIHAILQKYFGKNTQLVDSLANFMATRFAQISALAAQGAQLPIPVGQYGQTTASPYFQSEKGVAPRPTSAPKRHGGEQFAEGGSFLATRPTTAMFGERGPELATFTPLNRSGRDVGKLFGNASGGGMSGEIYVNVDLSPDLEARVVQRSMNGVGQVVSKVNRRKL